MKAFQQILNQPNHYLIQFDLAWQNLQVVEREFSHWKKKSKMAKVCYSILLKQKKCDSGKYQLLDLNINN